MQQNGKQDTAFGIVEDPGPDDRNGHDGRNIRRKFCEVKWTVRNRTRHQKEDGQMPNSMKKADNQTRDQRVITFL